ncbi:unnamed protein product, partial [Chrysoparadoxa australica]
PGPPAPPDSHSLPRSKAVPMVKQKGPVAVDGEAASQWSGAKEEGEENSKFAAFMQAFWSLSSSDTAVRLGAAVTIVEYIQNPETPAKDLDYTLKRLVRGICSSRECARQGFASCLSECLTTLSEERLRSEAVREKLQLVSGKDGQSSGMEEREEMLGKLFGCAALARSGRLWKASGINVGLELLHDVVTLHSKRKWMRQSAVEVALEIVHGMPAATITEEALPLLMPLLGEAETVSDLQPDQLSLALGLHSLCKAKAVACESSSVPAYCSREHMYMAGEESDWLIPLRLSASTYPKIHAVWSRVWDDLGFTLPRRKSLSDKRLRVAASLWEGVVGALANGSHNTKGLALLLLRQVLERVPAAGVSVVVSGSVLRVLLNHAFSEDNMLHSIAKMVLVAMPKITSDDSEVQLALAACLLKRGGVNFDARSSTRCVATLVEGLSKDSVRKHVTFLEGVVLGKEANDDQEMEEEEEEESQPGGGKMAMNRVWAVDSLYALTRNTRLSGSDHGQLHWAATVAGTLLQERICFCFALLVLQVGYFTPGINSEVSSACQSRLFSIAADLSTKPLLWSAGAGAGAAAGAASNESDDGEGVLEVLWGLHTRWSALDKSASLAGPLSEDDAAARKNLLKLVKKLRKAGDRSGSNSSSSSSSSSKLGSAFAALLMQVGLQMLGGEEANMAEYVDDLIEVYNRMVDKAAGAADDEEDETADPLAVLADVLLSIMAAPSRHTARGVRETAKRAWGVVCGMRDMTLDALETLMDTVCGTGEE